MKTRGIDAWGAGAARGAFRAACLLLAVGSASACGSEAGTKPVQERTVAQPQEPIPAGPGTFHGVGVVLTGLAIRADSPTVPEGDVTFSVNNAGAGPYTFVVRGEGMEARTDEIPPGGDAVLNTSLKPGRYELSTVPEQQGPVPGELRTVLVVTGGDTR